MSPAELLKQARDLTLYFDPQTAGPWPRAVALLTRQALETTMDALWQATAPGLERCSMRAQLLCLGRYVDPDVAARAAFAWSSLSRACHHHVYELAPTEGELNAWIADVEAVLSATASSGRP